MCSREENMAGSKIENINIQLFDGNDYSNWKFKLFMVLEYKECLLLTKQEKPSGTDQNEWNKMDLKARVIITGSMVNDQVEYINHCKTALEMMAVLNQIYESDSTTMQIHYQDQLSELKLANFKSVEEFFLQFKKLCNLCRAAGGKLEEKEKIVYLRKALPASYGHVKLLTNLIPSGVKKLEFMKEKIKELSIINF